MSLVVIALELNELVSIENIRLIEWLLTIATLVLVIMPIIYFAMSFKQIKKSFRFKYLLLSLLCPVIGSISLYYRVKNKKVLLDEGNTA